MSQTTGNFLLKGMIALASIPLEIHDRCSDVDAIVVLGAPLRPDGNLSLAGRERVQEAVECYFDEVASLLIFCGGAAHSAPEAPAMALRALQMGVPPEAILVEDRSSTTAENARFSAPLLRDHDVRSVRVISQPFHLRRGRRLFRKQGFAAQACSNGNSVQYRRPDLAWRWVAREYVAWLAHFLVAQH